MDYFLNVAAASMVFAAIGFIILFIIMVILVPPGSQ